MKDIRNKIIIAAFLFVMCLAQASFAQSFDTLSSHMDDERGVEVFEDTVCATLPLDAVKIVTTKKFMSEWMPLTPREKKQCATVIRKLYQAFLHNGRILGQLKNLTQYQTGKIGHCNFNKRLRQVYYIYNNENNTIYLLFLGSKNRASQSMYHSRTAVNKTLKRLVMQCSGALISTHAMDMKGYQAIAMTTLSDDRSLGEAIVALLANGSAKIEDDDEDEKIDEQISRLEQEARVAVNDYIELFWEENDLRNNKALLRDLVKADVITILKDRYARKLLLSDEDISEEVHAMVDDAYENKCAEEDAYARTQWIESVKRITFSDHITPEMKRKNKLDDKLRRIDSKADEVYGLLAALEIWYEGYPEYTQVFYKELERLFDESSDFNIFLATGDTRAYVKTRDELKFLSNRLQAAKTNAESDQSARISHMSSKVDHIVVGIKTRNLPDAYKRFKALLLQDCLTRMESLNNVTSFEEAKETFATIDDLIQDIEDLNVLEEAIEVILAEKALVEGSEVEQNFNSDLMRLFSLLESFETDDFSNAYVISEKLIESLQSFIVTGRAAFTAQKMVQIEKWHELMNDVINDNERDFSSRQDTIIAQDKSDRRIVIGKAQFLIQYNILLNSLRPVFKEIYGDDPHRITKEMTRIRREVEDITQRGYALSAHGLCSKERPNVEKLYSSMRVDMNNVVKVIRKAKDKEALGLLIEQKRFGCFEKVNELFDSFESLDDNHFEAIYHGMRNDVYALTLKHLLNAFLEKMKIDNIHTVIETAIDSAQTAKKDEYKDPANMFLTIVKHAGQVDDFPKSLESSVRHLIQQIVNSIDDKNKIRIMPDVRRQEGRMKWVIDIYFDWILRVLVAQTPQELVTVDDFRAVATPIVNKYDGIMNIAPEEDFLIHFEEIDNAMISALQRLYYPKRASENGQTMDSSVTVFTAA